MGTASYAVALGTQTRELGCYQLHNGENGEANCSWLHQSHHCELGRHWGQRSRHAVQVGIMTNPGFWWEHFLIVLYEPLNGKYVSSDNSFVKVIMWGLLSINIASCQYRHSHYKDKTVSSL